MNISKLTPTIPIEFDYTYIDGEGSHQTEKIKVSVLRLSFRDALAGELEKAVSELNTKPEGLADVFARVVKDWNLHEGEDDTPKLPITAETLLLLPATFMMQMAEAVIEQIIANPTKAAKSSAAG
jgi:hypothetical protein